MYVIVTYISFAGTYHHFDTVSYPRTTKVTKSWIEKAGKGIVGAISGMLGLGSSSKQSEEEEFEPFSAHEMNKLSLRVYLEGYHKLICSGNFPPNYNIPIAVSSICHTFGLLRVSHIFSQHGYHPWRKEDGNLFEVRVYTCM